MLLEIVIGVATALCGAAGSYLAGVKSRVRFETTVAVELKQTIVRVEKIENEQDEQWSAIRNVQVGVARLEGHPHVH